MTSLGEPVHAWHFATKDLLDVPSGSKLYPHLNVFDPRQQEGPNWQDGPYISRTVHGALAGATGPMLCRVNLWGEVFERPGDRRLAARHRRIEDIRDVSNELRTWACFCVRHVWDLLGDDAKRRVNIAERYARGSSVTVEELEQAHKVSEMPRESFKSAVRVAERESVWTACRDACNSVASAVGRHLDYELFSDGRWMSAADARASAYSVCLERRMLEMFGENWRGQ